MFSPLLDTSRHPQFLGQISDKGSEDEHQEEEEEEEEKGRGLTGHGDGGRGREDGRPEWWTRASSSWCSSCSCATPPRAVAERERGRWRTGPTAASWGGGGAAAGSWASRARAGVSWGRKKGKGKKGEGPAKLLSAGILWRIT